MTIAFTAYGVPQPKGSMRVYQPTGATRAILTDGNRNVKQWQRLIAAAARSALDALPEPDRRMLPGGVRCEIRYYLPRPTRYTTRKYRNGYVVPHTTRPDLDKLTRGIFDAMTHVIWHDDAQVVELVTTKQYAAIDAPARVDVRVSTVLVPVSSVLPLEAR